jgi:hypothetical protein
MSEYVRRWLKSECALNARLPLNGHDAPSFVLDLVQLLVIAALKHQVARFAHLTSLSPIQNVAPVGPCVSLSPFDSNCSAVTFVCMFPQLNTNN